MQAKTASRWAAATAALALAVLATVGLRWCLTMVGHQSEYCHGCGSSMGMDVGEHLAWWQDQLRSTPAHGFEFSILVLLAFAVVAVPLAAVAAPLADVRFQRQRFRPPGASYLADMLSDGILNPKIFSAAR